MPSSELKSLSLLQISLSLSLRIIVKNAQIALHTQRERERARETLVELKTSKPHTFTSINSIEAQGGGRWREVEGAKYVTNWPSQPCIVLLICVICQGN